MRDLAVLVIHLLATVARLAGPGGTRAVVAESVLVKQQLLILNRSRRRAPNLRLADRVVAGMCTLVMRPHRLGLCRRRPETLNVRSSDTRRIVCGASICFGANCSSFAPTGFSW